MSHKITLAAGHFNKARREGFLHSETKTEWLGLLIVVEAELKKVASQIFHPNKRQIDNEILLNLFFHNYSFNFKSISLLILMRKKMSLRPESFKARKKKTSQTDRIEHLVKFSSL